MNSNSNNLINNSNLDLIYIKGLKQINNNQKNNIKNHIKHLINETTSVIDIVELTNYLNNFDKFVSITGKLKVTNIEPAKVPNQLNKSTQVQILHPGSKGNALKLNMKVEHN